MVVIGGRVVGVEMMFDVLVVATVVVDGALAVVLAYVVVKVMVVSVDGVEDITGGAVVVVVAEILLVVGAGACPFC